jgi:hypothetical protein
MFEVHICPLEGQQLTTSCTCRRSQNQEQMKERLMSLDVCQKPTHVLGATEASSPMAIRGGDAEAAGLIQIHSHLIA